MKRYVVDTSLINKLVDGAVGAGELPNDGSFVASHIQIDEINRTKDLQRRAKLLKKFVETIDEVLPTESSVFDKSRFDQSRFGDGVTYESIKRKLDIRNGGKSNNSEDALIAEVAKINGYTLLTADFDLYQVAYELGIGTMYWTTT